MAARYAQLSNEITEPVVKYIDTAKRIQLRLASILCKLPSRSRYVLPKSMNVPKPSIFELLSHSRHDFRQDGGRAMCTKCYLNIPIKATNSRRLIMTECKVFKQPVHQPSRITTPIHIGNKVTHDSHMLYNLRGLIYCRQCGCAGSQRLYKLADQCVRVDMSVQSHGKDALKKLLKGERPRHIKAWPDEARVVLPCFSCKPKKK